jgi:archaemetzincin
MIKRLPIFVWILCIISVIFLLLYDNSPKRKVKQTDVSFEDTLIQKQDFIKTIPLDTTNIFWALHKITKPIPIPQPNDWLASHKENGQTYSQYIAQKTRSTKQKGNKIYLLPLGDFSKPDDSLLLAMTTKYVKLFFDVPVIVQADKSLAHIPKKNRRIGQNNVWQYQTGYILYDILENNLPQDAIAYMAITTGDLYPTDDWNFVFGQAHTQRRIGVSSLYRFKEYKQKKLDAPLAFRRIASTTVHEIGHILSILHCIHFDCVMNGSNNLEEADQQSMFLCPCMYSKT